MPIDSILTREQRTVLDVDEAASRLRRLIEDRAAPSLVHFYDHFVGAVVEFGMADMATREANRQVALGVHQDQLKALVSRSQDHNDRGLDVLAAANRHLSRFQNEANAFVKSNPKVPSDLAQRAENLHRRVNTELAALELKGSDITKVTAAIAPCFDLMRSGDVGRLPDFLVAHANRLSEARREPDRGTQENIPIWKIIGAVVAFGVFIWAFVQCGFFGCSLDIAAIMATIGFWATVAILLG